MTTAIIQFPQKASDTQRLAELGLMLASALPQSPPSSELDTLLERAVELLDNLDEPALDAWLARLNDWEAKRAELLPVHGRSANLGAHCDAIATTCPDWLA